MVQHFKPPFAMLSTHMKMPVAILAALLNQLLANLPEKALNIDTNPWDLYLGDAEGEPGC